MTLYRDPREDDAQQDALTCWRITRDERRVERRQNRILLAADVATRIGLYLVALAVIVAIVAAWSTTGDEVFGWVFVLVCAAVVVAHMAGVR
jgi:predicted Co/Zn/Cd cation transporter (cation efflux family)